MKILFVTSELATLYKRGGLADVSYALPVALSNIGIHVSVVMPYYDEVKTDAKCVGQLAIDFDRRRELVFIYRTVLPHSHVRVYLFRHAMLKNYDDDNIVARFAFFSKAVAQLYLFAHETLGGPYDIIHCNDWHTGLVPMLVGEHRKLGYRERTPMLSGNVKTIFTIHNLLYSGETGISLSLKLGIPKSAFHTFMTPLGRAMRLLEEGMEYADVVTTVSPTYASEVMHGRHGKRAIDVFRKRGDDLLGILNGIDTRLWDPRHDAALPAQYSMTTIHQGKAEVKRRLRQALHLPDVDVPMFGFVGRLEPRQKGLDLIARAVPKLPPEKYQLVILGTGPKSIVSSFYKLVQVYPNISFTNTFDERLARRIYAGCDFMLVPSKFEPCGLTQMIAMRYGTLPIVRKTGGLADSVHNGKTGLVFGPYTSTALKSAMLDSIALYLEKRGQIRAMSKRVMAEDFSWQHQVLQYVKLYRSLLSSHT